MVEFGLATGWEAWECIDQAFLEMCDEVVVLTLDGWEGSRGVAAEIALARDLGIPVRFWAGVAAVSPTFAPVAAGTPG